MLSRRPRLAGVLVVAAVLAVAGLLSQLHTRLVSSQAISIPAPITTQKVPLEDPLAAVWNTTAPVEVPLSAQTVTIPNGGGSIKAVNVRALHDADRIYFRLEWDDGTKDVSAFQPQQFRDAAAIQFPGRGASLPSFCMGQANGQVNIWQWKADWQQDIDQGFVSVPQAEPNATADYYPFQSDDTFYSGRAAGNLISNTDRKSPVENLVARGFGTLTTADEQPVQGKGVWKDGKWYVLFERDLQGSGDYADLTPGKTANVAFAVWNGSQGERDGLKQVSQFAELSVAGESGSANPIALIVAIGVIVAALAGGGYLVYTQRLRRD